MVIGACFLLLLLQGAICFQPKILVNRHLRNYAYMIDDPFVLSFKDKATGIDVKLIGSMHYNPVSVEATIRTLEGLAEQKKSASVIVESCNARWKVMQSSRKRGTAIRSALENEMQTASDVAERYGWPTILGDQAINQTNTRIAETFKQSLVDIFTPFSGGWQKHYNEITTAVEEALPSGPAYLGTSSFLNSRLMIATPLSLLRYLTAILIKMPYVAPIAYLIFFADGHAIGLEPAASTLTASSSSELLDTVQGIFEGGFFAGLEFFVFARIFLVALLAERNEVLAKNIREECARVNSSARPRTSFKWFKNTRDNDGDILPPVVIAVLGMAHCNGVKKILTEK